MIVTTACIVERRIRHRGVEVDFTFRKALKNYSTQVHRFDRELVVL